MLQGDIFQQVVLVVSWVLAEGVLEPLLLHLIPLLLDPLAVPSELAVADQRITCASEMV